jgi:hypothetical protein
MCYGATIRPDTPFSVALAWPYVGGLRALEGSDPVGIISEPLISR